MDTNLVSSGNTKTEPFFDRHAWMISLVVILFSEIWQVPRSVANRATATGCRAKSTMASPARPPAQTFQDGSAMDGRPVYDLF